MRKGTSQNLGGHLFTFHCIDAACPRSPKLTTPILSAHLSICLRSQPTANPLSRAITSRPTNAYNYSLASLPSSFLPYSLIPPDADIDFPRHPSPAFLSFLCIASHLWGDGEHLGMSNVPKLSPKVTDLKVYART